MDVNEISALLKTHGVRPTPQRICIYQYLATHPIHATADTVYDALLPENPTFSRTTVYNAIRVLTESGLLHPITIDGGFVRYDANVRDHGHFKCVRCGKVYDFAATWPEENAPELQGFEVCTRDLYLTGICAACAAQKKCKSRATCFS